MALGLVVGVPSLELMERILLQEKDGKRAFIVDPLTTSLSQPLPRSDLAAYLSRYPEVTGVDRAIAGLTNEATTSTAITIALAPHDRSKETERLLKTSNEVFFVTDIPHGKVFQQIDPIQDNATAIVDRWANLLGETDTTRQSAIFDEIKTAAKAIYVLHDDGVLRRVSPSSQFSTILSKKAPAVAVLPPTTFTSYATPGTVLSLAEMRNDFVRVSLDEKRDLVVTPLRDFVPGFDPEDPYALVTLSDPDTLFVFPLDVQGLPKPVLEQCSDQVDNDNDGLIDCRDALCENARECVPLNRSGTNDTGEPAQAAALMGEEVLNSGGEVAQGSPQSDTAEEIPTTLPMTDTNEVPAEPTQDSPTESPREAAPAPPLAEGENDSIEIPTEVPTEPPTDAPTDVPTEVPTEVQTDPPTEAPTDAPTEIPTEAPTDLPTEVPTEVPAEIPTTIPTEPPTEAPTDAPTEIPTEAPTDLPTEGPTEVPTVIPTDPPTEAPTDAPTEIPTQAPTDLPTEVPTEIPTDIPTVIPTEPPTEVPTDAPTEIPTQAPTDLPTEVPTEIPTAIPTGVPTDPPTEVPSETPTEIATETPTPKACGNYQLDSKEECDDSSSQYGDAYCKQIKESERFSCESCECVENPCGNSQLDSGEECDGSSSQYGDGYCKKIKESDRFSCSSCECVEDPCGNKRLDSGEECDASTSKYGDSYCKKIKESDRFSCDTCECVEEPCGNKMLDQGEECDDGNTEDGDGCTKQCKKKCSVGVESVFSDELEMKKGGKEFTINSTDPIDDEASHCDIVAVSSTRLEPTNKPPRNALGGSIGSPKFSYKRVSSKEITGKLSGLLWYGHGDGLLSCIPEVGGTGGEYSFEVTVEYKNGTKQTIKNEAFIGYGSGAGRADTEMSFGREIETKRLPGYPKKKGIGWECCVSVLPDPSDRLVTFQSTVVEDHPKELQYASIANSEEKFHARQGNAEIEYQQGGYKKNGVRLDNDAEVLQRYGLTQACGRTYLRDKEVSCLVAHERAYKEAVKITRRMSKDLKRWVGEEHGPLRCHIEYTAKRAIGLTRDKVGIDYKCGYELSRAACPNPAPVPPYFWEFIGR